MGWLVAQGVALAIGIVIGLICSVIGLFLGHIILFDSIAIGIVAGVCCNHFLMIHPALCIIISIAVFLLLFRLQNNRIGFWVIGEMLSLVYATVFGLLAFVISNADVTWGIVVFVLGFLVMQGLHLHARDKCR